VDDTGRTEPGDNPDPDRDDPDRPGWAAPQPPPSAPPPPPPGSQPPWTAEAQQPPPAPQQWNAPPQPQPPPASQQWGAQAPPPAPQWGAPPAPASGGPPTQPGWNAPPGAPPAWNAPAPPGPSGPPGPPGKRRGWAWLWALIVGLVVLTGVAVAGVVVAVSAYTKPADATNAYLRDVRDGQYAAAYAHLCSTTQSQTSLDEFRSQQQSNSAGDQIDTFDVYYSVIHGSGNTATTRYTIQRFFTRERWEVDLVKESGDWRPCTFTQLRY
jgi:hypothetical protein